MYLSKAWRASCFSLVCSAWSDVSLDCCKHKKEKQTWKHAGILWGMKVGHCLQESERPTVLMHSSTAWVYSSTASSSFPFSSSSKACVTRKWARSRSTCCRDFRGSLFCAWTGVEGMMRTHNRQFLNRGWQLIFLHQLLSHNSDSKKVGTMYETQIKTKCNHLQTNCVYWQQLYKVFQDACSIILYTIMYLTKWWASPQFCLWTTEPFEDAPVIPNHDIITWGV